MKGFCLCIMPLLQFQHPLLSSSICLKKSLFLSLTSSVLIVLTDRAHSSSKFNFLNQKKGVSGETEFWYELVALPEKLLHALYDSRDSGSAGQESLNSTSDRETTLQYAQSLVSLDQIWLCTKQELVKLVTPHHGASLSCQLCDLCHASPFTQTQLIQTTSKKSQIRKLLFLTCWPQKSCL